MHISCKVHGGQIGMLVSPDLCTYGTRQSDSQEILSLIYLYLERPIETYFVSRRFADEHGLAACVDEVPDYLPWVHELKPQCVRCFKDKYGGYFDELHRWHSGPKPEKVRGPRGL